MRRLSDISDLSFPDRQVFRMDLDIAAHSLSIKMSGGWCGHAVGAGELVIHDWSDIVVRRYVWPSQIWETVTDNGEELVNISEMIMNDNEVVLRGFGKTTGQWMEYVAIGGKGEYLES